MKKQRLKKQKKNLGQQSIKELLEKNPEISLAQKIMQQNKKTQKPAITVEQGNYYKLPEKQLFS